MTALFAAVRALHFASLMGVFGAHALLARAGPLAISALQLRRALLGAALISLITALFSLGFVAAEMSGGAAPAADPQLLWNVLAHAFYGHVFALRLVSILALIAAALARARHGLQAVLAGLALAAMGLTSHAAAAGASAYQYVRAANDAIHLLTAGFWVGGLTVLLPAILANPFDRERAVPLLRLFSRWGAVSVALLIVSGTVNGIAILDVQDMAWSARYVTLLAIKVTLAAAMVALALTNRFGVLPALERGDKEAAETIPLTVAAELLCALVILGIVGFLGLMAPIVM